MYNFLEISTKSAQDGNKIHILGPQVGQRPLVFRPMCLQTKPKEHICQSQQAPNPQLTD